MNVILAINWFQVEKKNNLLLCDGQNVCIRRDRHASESLQSITEQKKTHHTKTEIRMNDVKPSQWQLLLSEGVVFVCKHSCAMPQLKSIFEDWFCNIPKPLVCCCRLYSCKQGHLSFSSQFCFKHWRRTSLEIWILKCFSWRGFLDTATMKSESNGWIDFCGI